MIGWWISVAAVLLQVALTYNTLPARMASHFNASGKADGWSSRGEFLAVWFLAIVFVNIWPLINRVLLRKIPTAFINMPHKEYWLADPKRAAYAFDIVSAMLAGILTGANVLLILVYQYTYDYNLHGSSSWNIWLGLALEAVITIVVIVWGYRTLGKTDGSQTFSSTNV